MLEHSQNCCTVSVGTWPLGAAEDAGAEAAGTAVVGVVLVGVVPVLVVPGVAVGALGVGVAGNAGGSMSVGIGAAAIAVAGLAPGALPVAVVGCDTVWAAAAALSHEVIRRAPTVDAGFIAPAARGAQTRRAPLL